MFHRLRLSRKGQGISLNAIVIAVLALVVLVVLVMVFTGRMGIFQSQIGGEAKVELQAMKASYGDCHPTLGAEGTFINSYETALRMDAGEPKEAALALAKDILRGHVNDCKNYVTQGTCPTLTTCSWR